MSSQISPICLYIYANFVCAISEIEKMIFTKLYDIWKISVSVFCDFTNVLKPFLLQAKIIHKCQRKKMKTVILL